MNLVKVCKSKKKSSIANFQSNANALAKFAKVMHWN